MLTKFLQKALVVYAGIHGFYLNLTYLAHPIREMTLENFVIGFFGVIVFISAWIAFADPPIPYKEPTER